VVEVIEAMPRLTVFEWALAVFAVGGVLLGAAFRWWAVLVPVGLGCFLVYGWEFSSEGVVYAAILVATGCPAVAAGVFVRRALRG
jgi:hypothetical protein